MKKTKLILEPTTTAKLVKKISINEAPNDLCQFDSFDYHVTMNELTTIIVNVVNIQTLLTALTVIATASMAITGVIQAYRHNFDPLGAAVLALITAVGGGTVRDLLLGATPVFWVTDLVYIITVVPVAVVSVILARFLKSGAGRRQQLLSYIDAIGLALFTIVGVQKSLNMDVHYIIAIVMGAVTGVAGGMIRDLLCGEPPTVLREDLYMVISLAGGALLIVMLNYLPFESSSWIAFFFIVLTRFWVIHRGINLPPISCR